MDKKHITPPNYSEELKQAYTRMAYVPVFVVFFTFLHAQDIPESVLNRVTLMYILYAILAIAELIFLKKQANLWVVPRKVCMILLDLSTLTVTALAVGENAYILLFLYLWIIMGNGMRFGLNYLYTSLFFALIGLSLVAYYNPYFTNNLQLIIGIFNIVLVLSLFFTVLIKRLEEKQRLVEKTAEAKTQFVANMSHEIRTPLNAILGFVDVLSASEKDPKRLEYFRIIKDASASLLGIINDILDFSKIHSDKVTLEKSVFETYSLFSNVNMLFSELASQKGVTLEFYYDEKIPKYFLGDEVRVKQVMFNLLSNAIKFTPKGGKVTLTLSYDKDDDTLKCSVKDSGVGISKSAQKSIFNAFEQEDNSTTRKFGGTGLGLSIASSIIRLMDSEIMIDSMLGEYSEFYFTIKFPHPNKDILIDPQTEEKPTLKHLNAKVLLVEDNKMNQMLMQIFFDELGLEHDIAQNGQEGFEMYKEGSYDIILMDENMPILNGIEATRLIRAYEVEHHLQEIPIIAQSANVLSEDVERFLAVGMTDTLAKPIKQEKLQEIIGKYTK